MRVDEKKLRMWMALRGIGTVVSLAERSGVHYTTISSMLKGSGFRSETLDALARALDVNPLDLLDTEDYPAPHMVAPAFA